METLQWNNDWREIDACTRQILCSKLDPGNKCIKEIDADVVSFATECYTIHLVGLHTDPSMFLLL